MFSRRLLSHWSTRSRVALVALALISTAIPGSTLALGGSGSITGTVFDSNGAPAAGVYVGACNGTCEYAATGANGVYTVSGLAAGDYRIGIEDFSGVLAGGYATTGGLTTSAAAASVVSVGATPVSFDVHATAGPGSAEP